MKRSSYLVLLSALTLLAVAAALAAPEAAEIETTPAAPATAESEEISVAEPAAPVPEVAEGSGSAVTKSTGITCTFHCNDGIGLLYNCPDPSLGTCCSQAEPACASHGGLDNGICKKGRLGLSCSPV